MDLGSSVARQKLLCARSGLAVALQCMRVQQELQSTVVLLVIVQRYPARVLIQRHIAALITRRMVLEVLRTHTQSRKTRQCADRQNDAVYVWASASVTAQTHD